MTKFTAHGELIEGKQEHTIHAHIIEPFRIQSEGGAKYVLLMIIGKLRYGHVTSLKTREAGKIQDQMLQFINLIERKRNQKVQAVRTDGAKAILYL